MQPRDLEVLDPEAADHRPTDRQPADRQGADGPGADRRRPDRGRPDPDRRQERHRRLLAAATTQTSPEPVLAVEGALTGFGFGQLVLVVWGIVELSRPV